MPYTIYRKDHIERIVTKEAIPTQSSRAITDSTFSRDPYKVEVLVLQEACVNATFHEFRSMILPGDVVSVAINDKNDVIAVLNHTRNQEGKLDKKKMSAGDIGGILFFLAFPVVIGGAIFKKSFASRGWDNMTLGIAGLVFLIVILVIRGLNRQYKESHKALKELKSKS